MQPHSVRISQNISQRHTLLHLSHQTKTTIPIYSSVLFSCNSRPISRVSYDTNAISPTISKTANPSRRGESGNVIAALASFFIPGLGQLVQGRILWTAFLVVTTATLYFTSFLMIPWPFALILHLWSIINAATFKGQPGNQRSASYHRRWSDLASQREAQMTQWNLRLIAHTEHEQTKLMLLPLPVFSMHCDIVHSRSSVTLLFHPSL